MEVQTPPPPECSIQAALPSLKEPPELQLRAAPPFLRGLVLDRLNLPPSRPFLPPPLPM